MSEWVGGYWLGPFSLRLTGERSAEPLGQSKDGIEIFAGEKLSDWIEVGEVFEHVAEGGERVLEAVKGELRVRCS